MQVDDIFTYDKLVAEEKANLQKGMNFGLGRSYSVVLMSVRKGAPYSDQWDKKTGTLIYEGRDVRRTKENPDPKAVHQPMTTPNNWFTAGSVRKMHVIHAPNWRN